MCVSFGRGEEEEEENDEENDEEENVAKRLRRARTTLFYCPSLNSFW